MCPWRTCKPIDTVVGRLNGNLTHNTPPQAVQHWGMIGCIQDRGCTGHRCSTVTGMESSLNMQIG
jgi:hypothetical protein